MRVNFGHDEIFSVRICFALTLCVKISITKKLGIKPVVDGNYKLM